MQVFLCRKFPLSAFTPQGKRGICIGLFPASKVAVKPQQKHPFALAG